MSRIQVKHIESKLKMTTEEEYQEYIVLHSDLSKTYSQVYKHVMDFYPQPQEFINEAMPEINTYIENVSDTGPTPETRNTFKSIMFFAKSFKDFVYSSNSVFEEYKNLFSEGDYYIKNISAPKQHSATANNEFAKLIPALNKLISAFKRIEQKTDETAKALQKLQSDWAMLKTAVYNEKNGNAWPL